MLEPLDIRTLAFSNVLFGLIYGTGLVIFASKQITFKGVRCIGAGFIFLAMGFALIAARNQIPDWISVLLANFLVALGVGLVIEGTLCFRNIQNANIRKINLSLYGLIIAGFSYYTYIDNNINLRIILISSVNALQCSLIFYFLNAQAKKPGNKFDKVLVWSFSGYALLFFFRAIWTCFENQMSDFMQAGIVHGAILITFQLFFVLTSIAILLTANAILESHLIKQATIDPLTKIFNRRALEERVEKEISRCTRKQGQLSMAIIDLDHFKQVNDQFGHLAGDKALQALSQLVSHNIRVHDVFARYGGEEFVLLFPDTGLDDAYKICEKLRVKIAAQKIEIRKDCSLTITASFGVTQLELEAPNWDSIFKFADRALYQAKENGRNQVVCLNYVNEAI